MPDLLIDVADGVATLTMNRPEARNAFSPEMRSGLDAAFHRFENDEEVRCVVLRGAGEHFMAGGDVKSFAGILADEDVDIRDLLLHRIHTLHSIMFAMRRLPKPIVASVRGAAAGAGVSLAACCDLIIASEDAFFTLAYTRIGTSPDGGSTYALPRALGVKKTMEMALLGDRRSRRGDGQARATTRVGPDTRTRTGETAHLRLAREPDGATTADGSRGLRRLRDDGGLPGRRHRLRRKAARGVSGEVRATAPGTSVRGGALGHRGSP